MPTTWTRESDTDTPPMAERPDSGGDSTGFIADLMRDWQTWSKGERIAASCLLTAIVSGLPILFITTILGAAR